MSLKNSIERELGLPIKLRAGAPGSLRVLVDGEAIYSKQESNAPPNPVAIVSAIRQRTAKA